MIKFRDIGTYKNAVDVPYCKTAVALKNGMVVTADLAAKTVALPTATSTKGEVYIVINRIEKPEIKAPNEYTIEKDEYPRLFLVESLNTRILDMDMDAVTGTYSAIAVGNKLAADVDGKLKVISDATGYKTYFEVTEKTSFGGEGIAVKVVVA